MKKFRQTLFSLFFAIQTIIFCFQFSLAQETPLTYVEIITALNTKVPNTNFKNKFEIMDFLIKRINFVGVEGELTPNVEKLLWRAGASDQLMKAIKVRASVYKKTFSKIYQEMSDAEKKEFISYKTNEFLEKFGGSENDKISSQAVEQIRRFVDGYLQRLTIDLPETGDSKDKIGKNNCSYARDSLTNVLKRGSLYSPVIIDSYLSKGVQPEIGIYLALLESEFCPCLQTSTGALGMFQFTTATASLYGIKAVRGATSNNPDERCNPNKAALASAEYIKMLGDRFYGKDVSGMLFSVAAYNSGEGALNKNIATIRQQNGNQTKITFWDLAANRDKLSQQFQMENFKYVPKFLAAAIIGENPKSFGLVEFQPLSSFKNK